MSSDLRVGGGLPYYIVAMFFVRKSCNGSRQQPQKQAGPFQQAARENIRSWRRLGLSASLQRNPDPTKRAQPKAPRPRIKPKPSLHTQRSSSLILSRRIEYKSWKRRRPVKFIS